MLRINLLESERTHLVPLAECSVTFDGFDCRLSLHRSGITKLPEPAEGFVSSDDAGLSAAGGVAKDIRLAAGAGYEEELRAARAALAAPLDVGTVVVTPGGNLAHHVFTSSRSPGRRTSRKAPSRRRSADV